MGEFTHFNEQGHAVMVDVSEKQTRCVRQRQWEESACRRNVLKSKDGWNEKGDVLGTARIAGIMGAKRTSELIPLCHILNLSKVTVEFEYIEETCEIEARCTTKTVGKTGVEMEALTGVQVALLTIYDMCKAVDKGMCMTGIRLLKKQVEKRHMGS